MNKLSNEARARVINCLVEGSSMRATSRMTGVAINTVVKLLEDAGRACSLYQDRVFRNLPCKRIQCDEVWSFVGCKQKNVRDDHEGKSYGDRNDLLLLLRVPGIASDPAAAYLLHVIEKKCISHDATNKHLITHIAFFKCPGLGILIREVVTAQQHRKTGHSQMRHVPKDLVAFFRHIGA